jgi:hypothetical protein
MVEVRLLANGMVGNGFSYRGFEAGLERAPHMIGCDAGTSDYGPGPLGSGRSPKPAASVRRDVEIMLKGARQLRVPLVFGSCGVAGAAPHVAETRAIVEEVAQDLGLRFRLAVIHSDQNKEDLKTALRAGRIRPLGPVDPLTEARIDESRFIVGMAGAQPLMDALDDGAEVILAGRCTDPAIFACVALRAGIPEGVAWHAARSIDKGSLATTDVAGGSPVLATVTDEGFIIEPTKLGAVCTVKSVAALTMYENPDPWSIRQPAGSISAEFAHFEQLDERRVRVTGSQFTPRPHTIKLEGAIAVGFRAAILVGIRDPRIVNNLDDFLLRYRAVVTRIAASLGIPPGDYHLTFRAYGRDAVMGSLEPRRNDPIHEIGLIVDVVARSSEEAESLLTRASSAGAKLEPQPGIPAGGNFAAPFSPNLLSIGEVFEWSAWHLLDVDNERDPFRVELVDL